MRWNKKEIDRHTHAGELLTQITGEVWNYIRSHPDTNEHEIEQFVQKEFKKAGLISPKPFNVQIVGFNAHTAIPHYFPPRTKSSKLKPNTLILLDIWAKLNKTRSPFADITWIAYHGKKVPQKIQKVFNIVLRARDSCLNHLQKSLQKGKIPTGAEMDKVTRDVIINAGYGKKFIHGTGHCLGFTSPHGKGVNLTRRFRHPLEKNVGYTIEPGIYLKNKFGIRSEINFYINSVNKVIITTPPQRKIVSI